jgi:threonine dehydrogenase-like Zn-dependent dehydrogenase
MTYRDEPEPEAQAGDALVAIEAVGICGSDMHAYLGHDERRPAPLILGHEAAGEIIEGASKGSRVTVNPLVTCGTCRACRQGRSNLCPTRQIISMPPREGAFAEFLAMPAGNLVDIPQGFAVEHAALAEPLAVCWHAVRLSGVVVHGGLKTARCLVIGGGAIGFGSALSLKAFGAHDITIAESNDARARFVADQCDFNVIAPGDAPAGGFDLVIDAVGYRATRAAACVAVRPGGVICHIGLGDSEDGVDIRRLTLQEITFFGTYAYTAQDFRDTCAAMFDGRLGAFGWIQQQSLSSGAQAFRDLRAGQIMAPKVVLRP